MRKDTRWPGIKGCCCVCTFSDAHKREKYNHAEYQIDFSDINEASTVPDHAVFPFH